MPENNSVKVFPIYIIYDNSELSMFSTKSTTIFVEFSRSVSEVEYKTNTGKGIQLVYFPFNDISDMSELSMLSTKSITIIIKLLKWVSQVEYKFNTGE